MSRLPVVSSDGNAWGTVLNDFLSQAHNADGSIKNVWMNVKDPAYGATGNGVTDDTAAIQAAINAVIAAGGGTVYFPFGAYLISASLIIDSDNVALLGFGSRKSAPSIVVSAADPTYALIVGNTKNVNNCLISGLEFLGLLTTTSTGSGILFRCGGGKIVLTRVVGFGGTGINVVAFSGTIFEVYLEDVLLIGCGMNATVPGDNLLIGATCTDSEYHRVLTLGLNISMNTTRNGIFVNGAGTQKFVDCHAYWCSNDGLLSYGANTQVIAGEYETNAHAGVECQGARALISAISAFSNVNSDIIFSSLTSVLGNDLGSSGAAQNILVNSGGSGNISDNLLSSAVAAIVVGSASNLSIHDNNCAATTANVIYIQGTNCDIHDNTILGTGNIVEATGANSNYIHDNALNGGTITKIGAATIIRDNTGYNPVGSLTAPGVPATTVSLQNTFNTDVMVYILGGTITVIAVGNATGTTVATGLLSSAAGVTVMLRANQWIKLTYSVAPTWKWFGL